MERDLTRLNNIKRVKQQLFNNAAISRADIARNTGLHKSTISSIFAELDQQGYIAHLGRGNSTEGGGRKPELFTINSHFGYVACFNITYDSLFVMFLYADGQEISFQRFPSHNHDILQIMDLINRELATVAKNNDTEHGLLGISFSIHAVVDQNKIIHSPYYATKGIDLQQYFADRYQVPVMIGNEANLAAIYERDYANQDSLANLVVLSIHRGPGIGVIANHKLFSGFHGMVGELGSVIIPNTRGELQEVGDYISVDDLVKRVSQTIGHHFSSLKEFYQVCTEPTAMVQQVLDVFADTVAQTLFNLQMLYGPERLFINSPLTENIPGLTKQIKAAAKKRKVQIPITPISGSKYVSLLGAGALMIRKVINLAEVNLQFQWSRGVG
ncbi:ROK family transcriptional regulator [Limosilactobacillus panis]|uniref:ROK family transcriptional regulator n=1 Tax=Limosilactobacillus panis TaxID=47493 RepID=UPI001C9632E0|nr:ROK family transcriptional regulator [Limosilactobacillus panis]QZN93568.1 ROK family transcriptional regulator [Limosilactobacillus panis]